jgi:hypothetical protein
MLTLSTCCELSHGATDCSAGCLRRKHAVQAEAAERHQNAAFVLSYQQREAQKKEEEQEAQMRARRSGIRLFSTAGGRGRGGRANGGYGGCVSKCKRACCNRYSSLLAGARALCPARNVLRAATLHLARCTLRCALCMLFSAALCTHKCSAAPLYLCSSLWVHLHRCTFHVRRWSPH